MLRPSSFAALILACIVLLAACSGTSSRNEVGGKSPDSAPATSIVSSNASGTASLGEALYVANYTSLEELTSVYGDIIVGTVNEVLLPFDPRPGYKGLSVDQVVGSARKSSWTPSAGEMSRPPGRNFSVYAIRVDVVLRSLSLKIGEEIGLLQPGGLFEGTAYQIDGDPVVQAGAQYLFLLQPYFGLKDISVPEPWGATYSGPPFARFLVDKSGRYSVVDNAWLCELCKAPRALHGTSAATAAARIQLATEGKLGEVDLAPTWQASATAPVTTPIISTDEGGRPTISATSDIAVTPTPDAVPGSD